MTEPTVAVLSGNSIAQTAKRYFLATRPKFFTASVLPLIVGSILGWLDAGTFDDVAFALALVTVICVHAGANVLNDVFDDINDNDRVNEGRIFPYTGGSRFIQNGVVRVAQMMRLGVALLVVGLTFGTALALHAGPAVIGLGLTGIALGVLYSAPPCSLSARGFGEATVGVAFGVLPVVGGAWLQAGSFGFETVLLSLPISLWVTAILLINEVPDATADAAVDRKTFVVRFGIDWTRYFYMALHGVAFLAFVTAALSGMIPLWGLALPALMLVAAAKAARAITPSLTDMAALRSSIEMTLGLHMLGSLWLVGVLLSLGIFS
jgi:1,4-dihydroxy-2-naphthoate octaprenyltransferase